MVGRKVSVWSNATPTPRTSVALTSATLVFPRTAVAALSASENAAKTAMCSPARRAVPQLSAAENDTPDPRIDTGAVSYPITIERFEPAGDDRAGSHVPVSGGPRRAHSRLAPPGVVDRILRERSSKRHLKAGQLGIRALKACPERSEGSREGSLASFRTREVAEPVLQDTENGWTRLVGTEEC